MGLQGQLGLRERLSHEALKAVPPDCKKDSTLPLARMESDDDSEIESGIATFQKGSCTVGRIGMESDQGEITPDDANSITKKSSEILNSGLEELRMELATLLDRAFTTTARSYWPPRSKKLEGKNE